MLNFLNNDCLTYKTKAKFYLLKKVNLNVKIKKKLWKLKKIIKKNKIKTLILEKIICSYIFNINNTIKNKILIFLFEFTIKDSVCIKIF